MVRLAIGGVVTALLLAGCGAVGQAAGGVAADQASGPSASAGAELGDGVTRSPGPAGSSRTPDADTTRGGDPTPERTPTVTPVRVTLLRTGGYAGARDELTVAKDGGWTYTTRQDERRTGRLTGDETRKLHRLAGDPRLAEEARKRGDYRNDCPDTFRYQLTAGDVTVIQSGCGDQPDRPVYQAIVKLLSDNTAF